MWSPPSRRSSSHDSTASPPSARASRGARRAGPRARRARARRDGTITASRTPNLPGHRRPRPPCAAFERTGRGRTVAATPCSNVLRHATTPPPPSRTATAGYLSPFGTRSKRGAARKAPAPGGRSYTPVPSSSVNAISAQPSRPRRARGRGLRHARREALRGRERLAGRCGDGLERDRRRRTGPPPVQATVAPPSGAIAAPAMPSSISRPRHGVSGSTGPNARRARAGRRRRAPDPAARLRGDHQRRPRGRDRDGLRGQPRVTPLERRGAAERPAGSRAAARSSIVPSRPGITRRGDYGGAARLRDDGALGQQAQPEAPHPGRSAACDAQQIHGGPAAAERADLGDPAGDARGAQAGGDAGTGRERQLAESGARRSRGGEQRETGEGGASHER